MRTNATPLLGCLLLRVCKRDLDRIINDKVHEFVKALYLVSTLLQLSFRVRSYPELSLNAHS
jgi:hypothetical protein